MQTEVPSEHANHGSSPPMVDVVIEIPRGSFLKRGSQGQVDFVSPLPCPFNYGSVSTHIGLEGDLLDAVVLGRRLPFGEQIKVYAWGSVGLTDRGMYDDKLICGLSPPSSWKKNMVLTFFHLYAHCKWLLNLSRGQVGRNACEGWGEAHAAIGRAIPRRTGEWTGPRVRF